MRLQHITEQVYSRPWLITPSAHASIRKLLEHKLSGQKAEGFEDFFQQRGECKMDENGIGHVYVLGVIGHKLSNFEKTCGCTDVNDIKREIMDFADQGANGILMHIDSPGGTVTGVPELSDFVAAMNQEIPIYAFVDSLCASAAYWLASACKQIWSTESAELGSIGVYIPWVDQSGMWDAVGLQADPIVSEGTPYKATGFGPSLSEEQRAKLQEQVDRTNGLFRGFVQGHRAIAGASIIDEAMMGQCVMGIDCPSYGLTDQIGDEQDCLENLIMEANTTEFGF